MRPFASWVWLGCLIVLLVLFFGPVLFRGEQFGYRDAAHYYYPLYQRVEQEWKAGRIPLWEPEENGGMPLLGNPTAAVLYPLKLCYTLAPSYDWGARIYTLAHLVLAVVGTAMLARHWGLRSSSAWFAGISYGFGGPILFQYCNIIFLVGAAWAPWGFLAVDRWLVGGHRRAIGELAVVLAMQTLGGDPQVAYLTGLCAAGYALILARRTSLRSETGASTKGAAWLRVCAILIAIAVWVALCIGAAVWFQRQPPVQKKPLGPLPWMPWLTWGIRLAWGAFAVTLLMRWRRSSTVGLLDRRLAGLLAAGGLAVVLAGAQLLPVLEFTSRSVRSSGEGPHDFYPFSLEPIRIAEFLFPGVFGSSFQGNSAWLWLLPPRHSPDIWVPSLYLGALTAVLALSALTRRDRPQWLAWMTAIAVILFLGSLGRFGSPIFWARAVPGCSQWLGPHDTRDSAAIRFDGHLRDGDGGIYWLLATVLPGFGAFRYPSKLLTLTCLAVALLAGSGWDRAVAGNKRRALVTCLACLAATLVLLAVVFVARTPIVDAMTSLIDTRAASIFGPTNPERAWLAMRGALLHASIVLGLGACLLWLAPLRPALAGALVLCLLSGDLTLANRSLVMTVPESMFAERPELIKLIEDAERADPAPGGLYRIHRLPSWEPTGWYRSRQPLHHDELVRWERKTIQPKYAIPYGIQYTLTEGVSELYDYMFFFAPFPGIYQDEALARRVLGPNSKDRVVAFPRRGFDLWNTRYFLLPYVAGNNEFRGIASFLPQTKAIAPPALEGESDAERKSRLEAWSQTEDWQLLRNEEAYPRAWVVHEVKFWPPLQGMGRVEREPLMYEILYQDDPFWSVRGREVYDPRSLAWIETDAGSGLEGYVTRAPTVPSETPRIVDYTPDRVEIEVDLQTPGIVILADVYYPGWTLTIDGKPAPIYRANRMMRGAAVLSGRHTLVYSYQPESFRYGVMASASALVVLLGIVVWSWRAPVDRRLSPDARPAGDHDGVARVEALS